MPVETQIEEAPTVERDPDAGALAVQRVASRRGVMPPLHRRGEDESYRVLEGELTFYVDGDELRAGPDDVVAVPRDARRTFRVESAWARWLVVTRVRSVARYEDFGRALACPVEEWPSAEEAAAVAAIAAANGIEVLGPPGLLP